MDVQPCFGSYLRRIQPSRVVYLDLVPGQLNAVSNLHLQRAGSEASPLVHTPTLPILNTENDHLTAIVMAAGLSS